MACRTKWASNNQLRSMAAGTVAGRYQNYFLICPVDSWDCGAIDAVPAAQTINGTHSSGRSPSLVLAGGVCHILIPPPNLFHLGKLSSASQASATTFLFIVRTGDHG
ncbi:hypothetical protein LEMLEM_LOCUS8396 [Lemmus lemmus]